MTKKNLFQEIEDAYSWEGGARITVKDDPKTNTLELSVSGSSTVEHDGDVDGICQQVGELRGKTAEDEDFKYTVKSTRINTRDGDRDGDADYTVYVTGTVTIEKQAIKKTVNEDTTTEEARASMNINVIEQPVAIVAPEPAPLIRDRYMERSNPLLPAFRISECDGTEVHGCCDVSGEDDDPIYEHCDDSEADIFCVFLHHPKRGLYCVGDFSLKADAEAYAAELDRKHNWNSTQPLKDSGKPVAHKLSKEESALIEAVNMMDFADDSRAAEAVRRSARMLANKLQDAGAQTSLETGRERRLLEAVADISYMAGVKEYFSGNSRNDIDRFIELAKKLETTRHVDRDGNETYQGNEYLTAIEKLVDSELVNSPKTRAEIVAAQKDRWSKIRAK